MKLFLFEINGTKKPFSIEKKAIIIYKLLSSYPFLKTKSKNSGLRSQELINQPKYRNAA